MSELRVGLKLNGMNTLMKVTPTENDGFSNVEINGKVFKFYRMDIDDKGVYFINGLSDNSYKELHKFMYEIAKKVPDTAINFSSYSTCSGISESYNYGLMEGKFVKWDDLNRYPYCEDTLTVEGINDILTYEEEDKYGFTKVTLNGNTYTLYGCRHKDDSISYERTWQGDDESKFFRDFVTYLNGKTVREASEDYETGFINVTDWRYENRDLIPTKIGYDDGHGLVYDDSVYFTAKDLDGKEIKSETENVIVKKGFFDKIVAFFRGLFKSLPDLKQ